MAVTFTGAGTNVATGSATSIAVTTATSFAVADILVALLSYDNTGSGGADPISGQMTVAAATGALGASVSSQTGINDPSTASNGLGVRCVAWPVTTAIPTSTSVTLSWSGAATIKDAVLMKVSGAPGTTIVNYRTNSGSTGTNSAVSTWTLTTPSVTNGEGVLCWAGWEWGAAPTGDADTTNGTWSAVYGTNQGGASAAGMAAYFQSKVVTATATQAWSLTGATSDWIYGCLIFNETAVSNYNETGRAVNIAATVTSTDTPGSTAGAISIASYTEPASGFDSSTSPKDITGLSWSNNDRIVLVAVTYDGSVTVTNVTNANLTFTKQPSAETGGTSESYAYIWTATATSNQSSQTISTTFTQPGGWAHGCGVYVITGNSAGYANADADFNETQFSKTVSAGSICIYVHSEFNATAGKTQATGSGTATERENSTLTYGRYIGDWAGVSAGTFNFGITSYAGTKVGKAFIEVLKGTGGAVNYNETLRQVTVAATVTTTDQGDFEDHPVDVIVAATVTTVDVRRFHDPDLTTTIAATVTSVEVLHLKELALTTTVAATVTSTGLLKFHEPAVLTAAATVTSVDTLTASVHYDETLRQVTSTATITTADQADFEDHPLNITATATITTVDQGDFEDHPLDIAVAATVTSVDQADFEDHPVNVAAVATVTTVDQADFQDHPLNVVAAATVTTTDAAHHRDLTLTLSVAATVTSTDLLRLPEPTTVAAFALVTSTDQVDWQETLRQVTTAATVTTSDQADFHDPLSVTSTATIVTTDQIDWHETDRAVDATATISTSDQADFEDHPVNVAVSAFVTSIDQQSHAGHYDETQRAVDATVTITTVDQADFEDHPVTVTAVATVTSIDVAHRTEALVVTALASTATTDKAHYHQTATVGVIATVTSVDSLGGHFDERLRPVAITATVTSTDVLKVAAAFIEHLLVTGLATVTVKDRLVVFRPSQPPRPLRPPQPDGWSPVKVSAFSPAWPWSRQQTDTYNPRYHLRQDPTHQYSQSPWKPKRTAIQQLRHPENYVIPLSTHPSEPNPYFERKVAARYASREERARLGQDINWKTLGTRGG